MQSPSQLCNIVTVARKQPWTICSWWACLCFNKTLFIKTGGRLTPDLGARLTRKWTAQGVLSRVEVLAFGVTKWSWRGCLPGRCPHSPVTLLATKPWHLAIQGGTVRWHTHTQGSLVAQMVKCLPAMRETWVWSLDQEDPLEKGMATHSITLAWTIPRTEEPGRL